MLGRNTQRLLTHSRNVSIWRRCMGDVAPGAHQGPVVAELWRRRQALAGADVDITTMVEKSPSQSATSIVYDFENDDHLREKYRSPWNKVRFGRILEDLDALAGSVAWSHCMPAAQNLHIVTASVERIVLNSRPRVNSRMTLQGAVSWVGRSSLEIRMVAASDCQPEPWLDANFVFVARERSQVGSTSGKAASINSLKLDTQEEKDRFNVVDAKNKRKKAARADVKADSKQKEILLQHANEMFDKSQIAILLPALADRDIIMMNATRLQNSLICQPQHQNMSGRVFGGFLMRRAFELAYVTAYNFTGHNPIFREVDEVLFLAPVNIGNILNYESSVLYTEICDGLSIMHIEVIANVIVPEDRTSAKSNIFHFSFAVPVDTLGDGVLRKVMPNTIEQAYRIVQRQHAEKAQA